MVKISNSVRLFVLGAVFALVSPWAAVAESSPQAASAAAVVVAKAQDATPSPAVGASVAGKPAVKIAARKQRAKTAPIDPTRAASVYLMRGFLGIFSLGMDRLNEQLKAEGIKTRILGHTGWPSVVADISAEAALHPGRHVPVVLVGHSLGGNAVLQAASILGKQGIPVDLVVTVDPTMSGPISPAVKRYLNIYMSDDGLGAKLAANGKRIDNDDIRANPDLNRPGVNHFSMDENPIVLQQINAAILKSLGRTGKRG